MRRIEYNAKTQIYSANNGYMQKLINYIKTQCDNTYNNPNTYVALHALYKNN